MRRQIRRGAERRDRGSTLTEMLVVMLILGIVVAATATLTIGITRTTGQNIARQDQVDAARTAVERISKTTRTAVKPSQLLSTCSDACEATSAFLQGSGTSMQFYANLNNAGNAVGPSRITYTVATTGADAGVLIEKVQRPDSATPSNDGYTYCNAEASGATAACKARLTVRRFTAGVSTASPVFTYYKVDGTPLTVASGGALSAADLKSVLAIEVRMAVRSTGPNAPKQTTYIQRITLPNAQAVMQTGEDGT
jgi:prepilin-type N-terminal cleavage/methylation domain-containing protein